MTYLHPSLCLYIHVEKSSHDTRPDHGVQMNAIVFK